jgi:cobalamin biosynthesis Mg chelatase CobN
MGVLDSGSGSPASRTEATSSRTPGSRFVVGITIVVVAFAAVIAFAMYWLMPLT